MIDKTDVINSCRQQLDERIAIHKSRIDELKESLEDNDSSKNADDDDGSGELMADFERANRMLDESYQLKKDFNSINWSRKTIVSEGALVVTNSFSFLIGLSLGEIPISTNEKCFVISSKAPIFQEMEGKCVNNDFIFNNKSYKILQLSWSLQVWFIDYRCFP